jgi:Protein of unknown function (DUF4230)
MSSISLLVTGFLAAIVVALSVAVFILFRRTRKSAKTTTVHSTIEGMRAVGDLSVFKVYTKEIVTELDHSWGEFGKKYLDWIYSSKKMAMIFEFEIEFSYDLRTRDFEIIETGPGAYILRMPPCFHEINIRNIEFYDEQRSRLLPWLLPDLLNGFLGAGFTEEDRNKLVTAASNHAKQRANAMIDKLASEVESSAKQTLDAIGRSFGANSLTFIFKPAGEDKARVNIDTQVTAAA